MKTSRSFIRWAVVALLVAASGCGSFSNNFNSYNERPYTSPTAAEVLGDQITAAATATQAPAPVTDKSSLSPNLQCEMSPFPATPPMPELPVNALQAAKGLEQIELIERKHIGELRKYIAEAKEIRQKNQLEFFDKCQVISKDKSKDSK